MSRHTIRSLLEAHGSYPDREEALANFEALFTVAAEGREDPADVAWGFLQVLDQWSHVDAVVEPPIARRLREWAQSTWAPEPLERCKQLGRLLVNVPGPDTLGFLQARRAEAIDPDLQALLDAVITDLSRSSGVAP